MVIGLGLIIFHGVSPRDSLMANCNKITESVNTAPSKNNQMVLTTFSGKTVKYITGNRL